MIQMRGVEPYLYNFEHVTGRQILANAGYKRFHEVDGAVVDYNCYLVPWMLGHMGTHHNFYGMTLTKVIIPSHMITLWSSTGTNGTVGTPLSA